MSRDVHTHDEIGDGGAADARCCECGDPVHCCCECPVFEVQL